MRAEILLAAAVLALASCNEKQESAGAMQSYQQSGALRQESGDSADWKAVDLAMGRSGAMQSDGVYKYSMPRTDLMVTSGSVALKPALALGSWVAFRREGGKTLAMGDLVLTEEEIDPVLGKLQEMGVEATALHNHLLHEIPNVMYLHIHGGGDPIKIAQAVHAALGLTKTPAAAPAPKAPDPLRLDTAAIGQALGHSGKINGGVYQVNVPRTESVRAHGMTIPPSMGVATAINFQPTGANKAAITGDFVMTAEEVSPVLKALAAAGIGVNSLHNHMTREEPRLFFLHFWANDDAVKLAKGLRSALDKMRVKPAAS